MRVILFQPQFAELVRAGTKTQTIRRTARCKPGDTLSLRRWTGKPYRSKQQTLCVATCANVHTVLIQPDRIDIDGVPISQNGEDALARADGFRNVGEMLHWFGTTHGFPFKGEIIEWSNMTHETEAAPGRR